jgi:hypothetical protein
VLSFALPTGLAAGMATFAAYEMAIAEEVTLPEARTTATLVLAATGLFALGIVSRPLLPWKKILIGSMIAFLVLLLVSTRSQEFFALNLPRPVVLVAAIGVVAITGTVMITTLRAVGWVRQVPVYLREHPPNVSTTWTDLQKRLTHAWESDEEEGLIERYRSWRPDQIAAGVPALEVPEGGEPEPSSEPKPPPPEPPAPEDLDTLEWFDTEDFLDS